MTQAITAVGTQVFLGPSVDDVGDFILIGELGSMTPVGREWDVNDVTSFTSPTNTKEKIKGLLNPGQYFLVGNRIFDDASQAALKVAFDDPRPYWFRVVFPVNPYTGGGEIWTFAALVLSIDPPKIAPNKALQFFCKLQATGARQTSNGYANATGKATKIFSATLGGYSFGMIWSDFSVPAISGMPNDAIITGIYPVIIASGVFDICFQSLLYSAEFVGGFGSGLTGTAFLDPDGVLGATFPSTQFTAPSIGTSLAVLSGQKIAAAIDSSLLDFVINDSLTVMGVGFAVVYASSKPRIDPLMAPPIPVPSGQGLAWALPFGISLIVSAGADVGTATGTAAVLNSI